MLGVSAVFFFWEVSFQITRNRGQAGLVSKCRGEMWKADINRDLQKSKVRNCEGFVTFLLLMEAEKYTKACFFFWEGACVRNA